MNIPLGVVNYTKKMIRVVLCEVDIPYIKQEIEGL